MHAKLIQRHSLWRTHLFDDGHNKQRTFKEVLNTISDVRHVPERTFLQVVIVDNVAPGQCSVVLIVL